MQDKQLLRGPCTEPFNKTANVWKVIGTSLSNGKWNEICANAEIKIVPSTIKIILVIANDDNENKPIILFKYYI